MVHSQNRKESSVAGYGDSGRRGLIEMCRDSPNQSQPQICPSQPERSQQIVSPTGRSTASVVIRSFHIAPPHTNPSQPSQHPPYPPQPVQNATNGSRIPAAVSEAARAQGALVPIERFQVGKYRYMRFDGGFLQVEMIGAEPPRAWLVKENISDALDVHVGPSRLAGPVDIDVPQLQALDPRANCWVPTLDLTSGFQVQVENPSAGAQLHVKHLQTGHQPQVRRLQTEPAQAGPFQSGKRLQATAFQVASSRTTRSKYPLPRQQSSDPPTHQQPAPPTSSPSPSSQEVRIPPTATQHQQLQNPLASPSPSPEKKTNHQLTFPPAVSQLPLSAALRELVVKTFPEPLDSIDWYITTVQRLVPCYPENLDDIILQVKEEKDIAEMEATKAEQSLLQARELEGFACGMYKQAADGRKRDGPSGAVIIVFDVEAARIRKRTFQKAVLNSEAWFRVWMRWEVMRMKLGKLVEELQGRKLMLPRA